MSFLRQDPLRQAAAFLVRAGAGSALTALVLLVLVSASGCGSRLNDNGVRHQAAVDECGAGVSTDRAAASEVARRGWPDHLPLLVPAVAPTVARGCVADATLPPTRGP